MENIDARVTISPATSIIYLKTAVLERWNMKEGKPKILIVIFTVICALFAVISAFSRQLLTLYLAIKYNGDIKNTGSIEISGNPHGPTVVWIQEKCQSYLFTAVFALIAISGIIYLVALKRKKRYG